MKTQYERNLTQLAKEYEEKKTNAELELNQLKIQVTQTEERFNNVIAYAADNICCKNRIDNPNIDSYIIANNRIVCSAGENKKISC
ncbi:MAG: hypothetical protein AABW92_05235 [Nanoarchaeota archaeon]